MRFIIVNLLVNFLGLIWVCVSLVVEVFGGWGNEAQEALSRVAKKLAIRTSSLPPGHYTDAPEC